MASKLYGVNATIIIFVFGLYCIVIYFNQMIEKKIKSTITECPKNFQLSVARDQNLTTESNL